MLRKLLGKVQRKLFYDRHDLTKAAVLAGSGRSGTTWVGQVLGSIARYRIMFEPFHAGETGLVRHWRNRQYVRPDDRNAGFVEPAQRILSGRVRSPWIDKINGELLPRGRLIKDIRIQMLLPWMHTTFPDVPIAIVTRHPCAVALSRMALGWGASLDGLLQQEELVDDYLSPFVAEMKRTDDEFEKQIIFWCAENYVPITYFARKNYVPKRHSRGDPAIVIRYEDICVNPEPEFTKLATFFGWSMRQESLALIHKPSAMTAKHSAILSGGNLTESWRRKVNDDQLKSAYRLLETFRLSHLYSARSDVLRGREPVRAEVPRKELTGVRIATA
jgi:hypothetical protein